MSSIKRVLCKLIMCIIILRVDSFQIKRSLDIYRKKPIDFYQPYNRKLYCQNEAETNIIQIDANSSSSNDQPFLNISSGFFLLNFVAILWGTQHCVIKSALDSYPSSSILNFWRFSLSTLLFMPSLIDSMKIKDSKEWKAGAELGLYTFLGFGFQAIGLETTTAARSAFLLYLNVKLVPFLGALVFKREIKPLTWVSAFLAFGGTCLLSTDGGPINIGDFWCIGAAVVSALFILRLEKFSQENNASRLNSISFFSVAVLCSIWVLGDFYNGIIDPVSIDRIPVLQEFPSLINIPNQILTISEPLIQSPFPVFYLGLVTTGLCNYLQTLGQKNISAERAAVIYSMDPVYGAFFSQWFLGEQLGIQGYFGAFLILVGVWVSSLIKPSDFNLDSPDFVEEKQ